MTIESTLVRLAPTQVQLEIPITSDELRAAEDRAFRRLAKDVRLPGFRKGKVPRRVFEQTYGADTITNQAMEDVVPELYARAVREHDLAPVDRPKMELLPSESEKPDRIKATVEVRPPIELGSYQGMHLEARRVQITDEEVERSLAALARERATLVPVDRPAQMGDMVTLDFQGTVDGKEFDGGSAAGQVAELAENHFIPGFAAGIAGMRAGETKDITAAFPANYEQADLAGKSAVFAITLHDVKELELPALDDAFAKTISENQTIAELRADVRKRLEVIADSRSRRDLGNQIMRELVASHDFSLPESLVEREAELMFTDATAAAERAGTSFDEYLKAAGKSEEQLRGEYREAARTRVKGTLLIEAIAKAEGIAATPADVQAELHALARQYGQPVDRVRAALGGNLLSLMDGIARNKTLEFLIDHAEIAQVKEATLPPAS